MATESVRHISSSRKHWTREIKHREVDSPVDTTSTVPPVAVFSESSLSSMPVAEPLSTSVKALIGFIVILGLVVIGVIAWRIGVWRRRKIRARYAAASSKYLAGVSTFEKSSVKVSLDGKTADEKSAYVMPTVPAIYPIQFPAPAHSPNKAVKKGTSRFLGPLSFPRKHSDAPAELITSPPLYDASPAQNTLRSTSGGKTDLQVEVPTRPPVTQAASNLNVGIPLSPIPSPRKSSYSAFAPDSAWKTPATSRPRSKSLTTKKLPRLMVVTCTFVPTLADELLIKVGETLRLVEEYEDEWCLVQRVGKPDAEKGVIPRFCLQERPEIMASLPKHKKGVSSLGSYHPSSLRH